MSKDSFKSLSECLSRLDFDLSVGGGGMVSGGFNKTSSGRAICAVQGGTIAAENTKQAMPAARVYLPR